MEEAKRILFLGGTFPKESEKIVENSIGSIQYAANKFQWNIVEGLQENKGISLSIFSVPFVGAWPKGYRNIVVGGNDFEENDDVKYGKYLNIKYLNLYTRMLAARRGIKQWLENGTGTIIIYSAHTPFLKAVYRLRKKHDFNIHLIVPDLPQYMNMNSKNKYIHSVYIRIDQYLQKKYLRSVNSFTFLTDGMNEKINFAKKPYVVVEGVADSSKLLTPFFPEEKTIVYAGGLCEQYGILSLIEAMNFVDKDVKLIICGAGVLDKKIRKIAENNEQIVYMGLCTPNKVFEIERSATVLVNPRANVGEYTEYSFPSKNLEYMLFRKPVMCFKLVGIPQEYDNYLIYFTQNNPEIMGKEINDVVNMPTKELMSIGNRNTDFVLKRKNKLIQTSRIIECINRNV